MLFAGVVVVSIADATLASPQHQGYPLRYMLTMFQSQTRRLLPRNHAERFDYAGQLTVSIADATLASPQQGICSHPQNCLAKVSIADATLASPQRFFLG